MEDIPTHGTDHKQMAPKPPRCWGCGVDKETTSAELKAFDEHQPKLHSGKRSRSDTIVLWVEGPGVTEETELSTQRGGEQRLRA